MMTNNMPETLNKHQKYREKNRKKSGKDLNSTTKINERLCQRNICEEDKQKLKEDGKLSRKNISKEDEQKDRDYMKEC